VCSSLVHMHTLPDWLALGFLGAGAEKKRRINEYCTYNIISLARLCGCWEDSCLVGIIEES